MISAEMIAIGVVEIDSTVAPSVTSAGMPAIPELCVSGVGYEEGFDKLARQWLRQPH